MRGTIISRPWKDGTVRYAVIFREGSARGSKQVWKTFATKRAAEDYLNSSVSDVAAGTFTRVKPRLMADVFAAWKLELAAAVTLGQLKRSTERSYLSVLTNHLIPAFGNVRSDALSTVTLTTWKAEQAKRITAGEQSPKTHNNVVGVLSACLEWAKEQHVLAHDPLPRKLRAPAASRRSTIVQGAEIGRLWQACRGQDRVIVSLALFAGLRRGEVFGLRWQDVIWPKGRTRASVRIEQAFVQRQITTPKSAAGKRVVNLPPRLVELLRQHARDRPARPLEDGATFVVRQDDGQPIDPDNWGKRVWPTIHRTAKLPPAVGLHALRHTFGSLLLADGAPIKHVSEQMGHSNVAITLNVYQHVLRATSSTATRQLDKHIPIAKSVKPLRLVAKAG